MKPLKPVEVSRLKANKMNARMDSASSCETPSFTGRVREGEGAALVPPSTINLNSLLCLSFALQALAVLSPAAAQPVTAPPDPVARFIEQARAATRPYHALDAAIAAGYRPIGPDMPNMGEHWIAPRLALQPFDPSTPSVLTYVRLNGAPVLTGIAFTTPVLPGEALVALPWPGAAWHYHGGTIEEELMGHDHLSSDDQDPRLAMVHAWIWMENPDGLFAADNWALPFVRLGLPVPAVVHPDAARTLFLLDGGVTYYLDRADEAAGLGPPERTALQRALTTAREHAAEILRLHRDDPHLQDRLAASWTTLWQDVRTQLRPEQWHRISSLAR